MRIKNYTDIPDGTIRDIIKFVRPPGISGFDVRVSNSKQIFAGTAYHKGCGLHDTANPFIVIRVTPLEKRFPYNVPKRKGGYLACELRSRIEAVVLLTAHELRHLWQNKYPHSRRLGGGKGTYSEIDADTYAIEKLKLWRQKHEGENMKITIIGRNCPKCHTQWLFKDKVDEKEEIKDAKELGYKVVFVGENEMPNYCPECGTHLEQIKVYVLPVKPADKPISKG